MADWAGECTGLHFIPPGQPWRNGLNDVHGVEGVTPDKPDVARWQPRVLRVANLHVSKEYREDLGEQDDEGYCDFEYRYWWYAFEVDGATS